MTSERKQRANRVNARASTGPQTAVGKARAAGNAHRHGLTLPVLADPSLAVEVKFLARRIAGEGANHELQEYASRIAEAQIDLVRVRGARHQLISRALGDPDYESTAIQRNDDAKPEGADKFATILADLAARLVGMDRYERRALSRRKFAIRALDAARAESAWGKSYFN
jgi:hypothetical protein